MGTFTLMIAQEQLPDNKNELKDIVYQLIGVVEEQKLLIANQNERIEALCQQNAEQARKNDEQSQKIDQLTYEISALKRHRFGKRSEKLKNENATPDNGNEATDTLTTPDGHQDKTFGPVIIFGAGGKAVEVIKDKALALAPLMETSA